MADRSETLHVTGIHCMNCIRDIGSALGAVDGLQAASATLTGEISIRYDDADPEVRERVVAALADAGFPVASSSSIGP
jgi:copper chaperone CopZ